MAFRGKLFSPPTRSGGGDPTLAQKAKFKHEKSVSISHFADKIRAKRLEQFLALQASSSPSGNAAAGGDSRTVAGNWKTSIQALNSAVRAGTKVTHKAVITAIQHCADAGKFEAAKAIFIRAPKEYNTKFQSLGAHFAVLDAATRSGKWQFATELALQVQKQVNEEYQLLAQLKSSDPIGYAQRAESYRRRAKQDLEEAEKAAAAGGAAEDDSGAGQAVSLESVMERRKLLRPIDLSMPVEVLNLALGSFTVASQQAERRRKRREYFEEMKGGGESASASVGGEVLRLTASSSSSKRSNEVNLWEKGLQLYFAYRGRGTLGISKNATVAPTEETLTELTTLLATEKQWAKAIKVLVAAEKQNLPVNSNMFDHCIKASHEAQQHRQVVKLVDQMVKLRMPPHESSVRMCITSSEEEVARLASGGGGAGGGAGFLRPISTDSSSVKEADLGTSSAERLSSKEIDSAWRLSLKLFMSLADQGLPLVPQNYTAPLRTLASAGKWELAARMLAEMKSDNLPVSSSLYETVIMSKIASGSGGSSDVVGGGDGKVMSESRQLLQKLQGAVKTHQIRIYNSLLSGALAQHERYLIAHAKERSNRRIEATAPGGAISHPSKESDEEYAQQLMKSSPGLIEFKKTLSTLKRSGIVFNNETTMLLLQFNYYLQNWERVLRGFSALKHNFDQDFRLASTRGYTSSSTTAVTTPRGGKDSDSSFYVPPMVQRMVKEALTRVASSFTISAATREEAGLNEQQPEERGGGNDGASSSSSLPPPGVRQGMLEALRRMERFDLGIDEDEFQQQQQEEEELSSTPLLEGNLGGRGPNNSRDGSARVAAPHQQQSPRTQQQARNRGTYIDVPDLR